MSTLRAFLAHPKASDDAHILTLREAATRALQKAVEAYAAAPIPIVVVAGRDDFAARAVECGGWPGWTQSVAVGRTLRDGTTGPIYDLIVVAPSALVGRGTGDIVSMATRARKPVYLLDMEREILVPVRSVFCQNPQDYQTGWACET